MAKREIKNLDLKIKLTNEYLRSGGIKKIFFKEILEGLINVKFDLKGKADPDSVSAPVNAFMNAILHTHLSPPFYSSEHISEYASTLQKSNSFDQENIDTIEQFDQLYEDYREKEGMLFRGQREAKWRLYSSIQRYWIQKELFKSNRSFQSFLESLVHQGRATFKNDLRGLAAKYNIDVENDIATLGYLQHHGCPTPLLDWTFKFPIALFLQ